MNQLNMNPQKRIREKAIKLLATREYGKQELLKKMMRDHADPEDVACVIEHLIAKGLQSDERFIENCINSYSNRGDGPLKIIDRLMKRGIEKNIIDSRVHEYCDWAQKAKQVLQKKFSDKTPNNNTEKIKQMRFLASRGFPQEVVQTVLRSQQEV